MFAWLKAWMQLTRCAGLATVMSNALASCLFVTYGDSTNLWQFALKVYRNGNQATWVLITSALLYLSGMIWNDLLDSERDCRLNPTRPIPSGRISLGAAFLAGSLVTIAALLASLQLGYRGFYSAGIVLSLSFLYNAWAKELPVLGALVMALVRFSHAIFALLILDQDVFDRMVLSTAGLGWADLTSQAGIGTLIPSYPLLLFCWIFGTTWISELESRPGYRLDVLFAGCFLAIPLLAVPWQLISAQWLIACLEEQRLFLAITGVLWVLMLLAVLIWLVAQAWWRALLLLERLWMGTLTRRLLGNLILLDAVLVATRQPLYAGGLLILAIMFSLTLRFVRMD